jgi:phosphosulfolactate phosphohydrolase-like enzyme
MGFEGDLRYAAQLDIFESVPVLYHDGDVKVLRVRPPRERAREA